MEGKRKIWDEIVEGLLLHWLALCLFSVHMNFVDVASRCANSMVNLVGQSV